MAEMSPLTSFLLEYALFFVKTVTVVAAVLLVVAGVMVISQRQRKREQGHLEVTSLNERYEEMSQALAEVLLPKDELKRRKKEEKRRKKAERKLRARGEGEKSAGKKRLFVLDFEGDIQANAVEHLREEISAVLTLAKPGDEVLVRLESGGGTIHGYGLAASQLERIRTRNIALTVAVDKIAASGGYLMACVADRLIAAPFSIIGSIGVLAQLPNFNRLLKKHDIDFEQLCAGEYKRTLTLFGENTDKAREKMQQELEEIHALFKGFVKRQRTGLDVEKVATGEHWLGSRALELGLVDELLTSDDYLMAARDHADIVEVHYVTRQGLKERLSALFSEGRWRKGAIGALLEKA